MSLSQVLSVILVLISLTVIYPVESQLNQQCLNCICQASTGCDLSKKCHNSGPSSYFCGPYQISWSYWSDGGRPGDQGGPHDFETCLNDKRCAEQAVQGYMAKWARDCNGDGFIDCADFAAIHKAGPNSCNAQWLLDSDYWRVFQSSSCASGTGNGYNGDYDNGGNLSPPRFSSSGGPTNSQPVQPQYQPQPQPQPHNTHWTFPSSRNQTYRPSLGSNPSDFRSFGGQPERVRYNSYNVPSNNNNNNPSRHEVFGPAVGQPPTSSIVDVTNIGTGSGGGDAGVLRTYPSSQPSPPLNNVPETGPYSAPSSLDQPSSPPVVSSSSYNEESNYEISPSNANQPVDSNCLDCLCQASTGCDVNKQCFGNVCGPYLISWPFWSDAGRPGTDYVSCALRKNCAEAAVQGYMSRFGRDCNNDGIINCDDYVMIHQYGPNCGPGVFGTGKFWSDYKTCHQPPIDARSNRVRENVERFRPIERPGQPANLRRDEPITWNGANNRFNENEIPGNRPVDRESNQPERINSFHDADDHSPFNPFPFNPSIDSPPPNFNRPNNSNVYFNDVHFPNQPFGPSGPNFGVPGQPRANNNNNNVTPPPPRNNFQPDQPTPIPPHSHVGPSAPNRFPPESTINNEFRPIINRGNNNDNQPRESRPLVPSEPNPSNNNNNGFQPGTLRNDGFRPILNNNNGNNLIAPPNNYPNQPNGPPTNGNFDSAPSRSPNADRFTPRYDRPNGFNFPSQPGFRPFSGNSDSPPRNSVTQPSPRPQPQPQPQPPSSTNPPPSEFTPVTNSPPTTISYSDGDDSSILPVPGIRDSRLLPSTPKVNGSMTTECLECICEATSKCDANYPCKNIAGNQFCGPYQISISYWLQSGKPGYNGGSSDFINCVTNMNCAQDTIKGYIKTLGRDCNNDGIIDCVDYALIHKLGPNSCQDQNFLDSPYWNDFQACYGFER